MTTASIVHTSLVFVTLMEWTACAAQPSRIGAPDGSYVPRAFTVAISGTTEVVDGAVVTPPFFAAEEVKPLLGRFFIDGDYTSGPKGVAVLSHRYWVERFQSAPTVIGSVVEVDGRALIIVGVAPPAFQPDRGGSLWIPKSEAT
jgi:hypothetical protein